MKLPDSGQTDLVLAHKDVWTLDGEDETSKLVCEFWIWKASSVKDTRHPRRIERYVKNKPKESSKVNTRPGVQRYAPSLEAVPAVEDIWLS